MSYSAKTPTVYLLKVVIPVYVICVVILRLRNIPFPVVLWKSLLYAVAAFIASGLAAIVFRFVYELLFVHEGKFSYEKAIEALFFIIAILCCIYFRL